MVKGTCNEIGKSTLLDGIIAALFRNPKSSSGELGRYISWGATRRYETSLEFEDKRSRYLLEKDFEKGAAKLVCCDTKQKLDTFKRISENLAELLGTGSEGLFLCTSCIRQNEVSEISLGKKEIGNSLEAIVTGGKENVLASLVIKKLDEKIAETKRGLDKPAKFPGRLKSLKSNIETASQRLKEIKEKLFEIEARKIKLIEIQKELVQIEEEHENSQTLLQKNKQRQEIEASIAKLTKDYNQVDEQIRAINSLLAEVKRLKEALVSLQGWENEQQVSEFRKRLSGIQIKRSSIEEQLPRREKEAAETKEKLDERKLLRLLSSRRFTIFAAIISVTIIGLAILAIAMWAKGVLVRERTKISDLEERIQQMKRALGESDEEQRGLLAQAKCKTIIEFDEKENHFHRWLREKEQIEAQLKGKLGSKTVEDIEAQRQEIARNLAVAQAKLTEDLKATALSPEKFIELDSKVKRLEKKKDELENSKRELEAAVKWAAFDAEEQIKLEEELESREESLRREEYRVKIYELAREFISKARAEVFSSATGVLEKEIQKHLAVFTDGKYDQVKVNKENLEFWIYSKEKNDWVKPEELSGGVIDEFYLACRLALVKLIFGGKKPPLILDDPFANFDDVRLSKTLGFLRKLSEEYQIIIFTLKDSYDKVADNIILLDQGKDFSQ